MFFPLPIPKDLQIFFLLLSFIMPFGSEKAFNWCQTQKLKIHYFYETCLLPAFTRKSNCAFVGFSNKAL